MRRSVSIAVVVALFLVAVVTSAAAQERDVVRDAPSDEPVTDAPVDVAPTDVAPTDVAPTDVAPTDVAPTDVPPNDVAPTDVGPSDVAPTDVAPDAVVDRPVDRCVHVDFVTDRCNDARALDSQGHDVVLDPGI